MIAKRTSHLGHLLIVGLGIAGAAAFSPHAHAAPATESDDPIPPPPDGYSPVQDMDATISAHRSAILATPGPGLPGGEAKQNTRDISKLPPHFSVFGVPVKFNAPVPPPYNAEATYRTYGGQPANGRGDATSMYGTMGQP